MKINFELPFYAVIMSLFDINKYFVIEIYIDGL